MEKQLQTKEYNKLNILHYQDSKTAGSCGYCKEDDVRQYTSYNSGFSTNSISAEMYERLMFKGWRRCGEYIYKKDIEKCCCKLYTIRLDIDRFKINKNKKKTMRNFRKFLIGDRLKSTEEAIKSENVSIDYVKITDYLLTDIESLLKDFIDNSDELKNLLIKYQIETNSITIKVYKNKNSRFKIDYASNLLMDIFFKLKKDEQKSINRTEFNQSIFSILDTYIQTINQTFNDKWDISVANTNHLNFVYKNREEFNKLEHSIQQEEINNKNNKKVEITVNKSDQYVLPYFEEFVTDPIIDKNLIKNQYTITLESNNDISDEKFQVFKRYQIAIHKDSPNTISKSSYKHSWGRSNLKSNSIQPSTDINLETSTKDNIKDNLIPTKYGTYDLVHRINDKIIAVGVLDILPTSVSSVYFYYDPDYSFLNLGVFSAIREIEYLRFLNKTLNNQFKFYAMGFYTHNCQKMRYKAEYFPTEILCPFSYRFVDIDDTNVQKILEADSFKNLDAKFSKENRDNDYLVQNQKEAEEILNKLNISFQGTQLPVTFFIDQCIMPKYKPQLTSNMFDMITKIGKNNIREFILTAE